ncbi:MAG: hypothetical protein Kow0097_04190 [Candidatus Bipolaricaulota bacterium]
MEALIPVDERGQMVLPKQVRERLGLRGGDRLALAAVRTALGPVAEGLLGDTPA